MANTWKSFVFTFSIYPNEIIQPPVRFTNGEFKQVRRRRQRESQKGNRSNDQNNNSSRASCFFVHFFAVTVRLQRKTFHCDYPGSRGSFSKYLRWNKLSLKKITSGTQGTLWRIIEHVSTRGQIFLLPSIDTLAGFNTLFMDKLAYIPNCIYTLFRTGKPSKPVSFW